MERGKTFSLICGECSDRMETAESPSRLVGAQACRLSSQLQRAWLSVHPLSPTSLKFVMSFVFYRVERGKKEQTQVSGGGFWCWL